MTKEDLIKKIKEIYNTPINYDGYHSKPPNKNIIESTVKFVNKYYKEKDLKDYNIMFSEDTISLYKYSYNLSTLEYTEYFIYEDKYGCIIVIDNDLIDSDDKENILIRRLTPRECLRIQDFDDTFKIVVSNSQIYKQAGNSMSVGVMEALINSIKGFEEGKISEFHKKLEHNEILDDF